MYVNKGRGLSIDRSINYNYHYNLEVISVCRIFDSWKSNSQYLQKGTSI